MCGENGLFYLLDIWQNDPEVKNMVSTWAWIQLHIYQTCNLDSFI